MFRVPIRCQICGSVPSLFVRDGSALEKQAEHKQCGWCGSRSLEPLVPIMYRFLRLFGYRNWFYEGLIPHSLLWHHKHGHKVNQYWK